MSCPGLIFFCFFSPGGGVFRWGVLWWNGLLVGFLVGGFFCGPGCCPQTLANIHASLTTTPIGTVLRKPRGNSLLPATGLHKPRQHQGLPTWPPSRWFPLGNLGLQMGSQRREQVRDDGGGAEQPPSRLTMLVATNGKGTARHCGRSRDQRHLQHAAQHAALQWVGRQVS